MNSPFDVDDQSPCDYDALDAGIRKEVKTLREHGVETHESCEGSEGHAFPDPTVRFSGGYAEGFRALAVAMYRGLKVSELRQVWTMQEGQPTGPVWEMTFVCKGSKEK